MTEKTTGAWYLVVQERGTLQKIEIDARSESTAMREAAGIVKDRWPVLTTPDEQGRQYPSSIKLVYATDLDHAALIASSGVPDGAYEVEVFYSTSPEELLDMAGIRNSAMVPLVRDTEVGTQRRYMRIIQFAVTQSDGREAARSIRAVNEKLRPATIEELICFLHQNPDVAANYPVGGARYLVALGKNLDAPPAFQGGLLLRTSCKVTYNPKFDFLAVYE